MKKYTIILMLILIFNSCTDTNERPSKNFTVKINNSSNDDVKIMGFNPATNNIEFDFTIKSMETGGKYSYLAETFGGYANGSDSIIVKFTNNKGYICDLRQSGNHSCFTNKNLLVGEESYFNKLGNNNYEFVITQEDFENAHDLP